MGEQVDQYNKVYIINLQDYQYRQHSIIQKALSHITKMQKNCCNSSILYRSDYTDPTSTFIVDKKQYQKKRALKQPSLEKLQSLQKNPIFQSVVQSSDLWLPSGEIDKICWDEIEFNPMWFYKQYISRNVPCVITDVLEGDDIFQRWSEPQYLEEVLGQYNGISMSLTPDGFADSIKGEFFVEPEEVKTTIKNFFNHSESYPNSIPYIQHQNSSLTQEMWMLHAEVNQDPLKFLSKHFFNDNAPEAQNFWMGFDQSVSSIHKDPYENFYTTVSGEKHFTLLPPIDVLYLEEQQFKKAKWSYCKQKKQFECHENVGQKTTWITCNPDNEMDMHNEKAFPWLSKIHKFHVTLEKSQTLFLPSMWYHQVSQKCAKDPYVLAINYWFDMEFNQNYSLYEICRKLKEI